MSDVFTCEKGNAPFSQAKTSTIGCDITPLRLLRPGDTVAIIATSGPVDASRLAKGVEVIKSMGLEPMVMESCRHQHGFLAGPDDVRLRDLHMAFQMPTVRGIFVARGGYGAGRLLPYVDFELIRQNPKVFVGYSDVTALHIAINQRCGLVTFHGPMPAADLWRGDEVTIESLRSMIFKCQCKCREAHHCAVGAALVSARACENSTIAVQPSNCTIYILCGQTQGLPLQHANRNLSLSCDAHRERKYCLLVNPPGHPLTTIVPGHATGKLTGGNLSLIAASIGTPYEIDTRGCILFLEEVGEEPYSVDRLLLQLQQAGKLGDAAGIILGDFSPETLETLHISVDEIIKPAQKPTIAGLKCGHTSPNITLPLGAVVTIQA